MKIQNTILLASAATGLVCGAAGSLGGYFFAKTKLEKIYEERFHKEVETAKKLGEAKKFKTPEEAVQALIPEGPARDAVRIYQGDIRELGLPEKAEEQAKVDAEIVVQNAFKMKIPANVDLGTPVRDPNRPYLIDEVEFLSNDNNYEQVTLTYYQGDNVLVDDKDEPIELVSNTVGKHTLLEFANLPEDLNTIYVRNETLHVDFEINRSDGKYVVEVLGLREK